MVGAWFCGDDDRPVLVSDGEKITGANERALALFRVKPEQIIGSHVQLWVAREDRQVVTERVKYLLNHRNENIEMPPLNYTFVRFDGTLFYAEIFVRRVSDRTVCARYRFIADIDQ